MQDRKSSLLLVATSVKSRARAAALPALLAGIGMFGGITPAFATYYNCTNPLVGPTVVEDADIASSAVGTNGSRSVGGDFPQDNYVSYQVTLTPYAPSSYTENFLPVVFKAETAVVNGLGEIQDTSQTADFNVTLPGLPGYSLPPYCNASTAAGTSTLTCTFDGNNGTTGLTTGDPAKTFTVLVRTPTAGEKIKLTYRALWREPLESGPCEKEADKVTSTVLSDPTEAVNTVLFAPGTVKTGTTGGAATGLQPWVTIVKVPAAAQVGVDLKNPESDSCPGCSKFSKIGIPGGLYGWGATEAERIRWYEQDAKTKLLVITLRKDVSTVVGSDPVKKALQILKEKIYYKPDGDGAQFQQVHLCLVTAGPTPGNPCIAYAQVYTKFNAPNVSNRTEYFGDHEWVIFANENGKYGAP